jgi:hypothetical protein
MRTLPRGHELILPSLAPTPFQDPDEEGLRALAGNHRGTGLAALHHTRMGFQDQSGLRILGGVAFHAVFLQEGLDRGEVASHRRGERRHECEADPGLPHGING